MCPSCFPRSFLCRLFVWQEIVSLDLSCGKRIDFSDFNDVVWTDDLLFDTLKWLWTSRLWRECFDDLCTSWPMFLSRLLLQSSLRVDDGFQTLAGSVTLTAFKSLLSFLDHSRITAIIILKLIWFSAAKTISFKKVVCLTYLGNPVQV